MKLIDKVALVTGACGGIGRAVALGLADEGADIVINDIHMETAEELKEQIEGVGRKTLIFKADVSRGEEVNSMVGATLAAFGRIDILVNCAGIMPRIAVADMSEEIWNRTIDINLKGTFLCCKAAIKPMMAQKGGKIVNISSGVGVTGQAKAADYAASKGGVIGFTKSLALEVASYGINVNAIAPGAMDTNLWRGGKSKEEIEEKLKIPHLPRGIGRPEDIVGTLIYLVTDASKSVTGQVIFMKARAT